MKPIVISVAIIMSLFLISAPALADSLFEVVADSTLNGNAGFVLKISEPGEGGVSLFIFEEAGKYRAYAEREFGSSVWDVLPGQQYLTPTTSMNISDSWRFVDEDNGDATTATVAALEMITTPAGTFSCYKVDVAVDNNPSVVVFSVWFSSGVGLVRQIDYFDNGTPAFFQEDLQSFSILGGTSFLPFFVGNTWSYIDIATPVQETTWGAIKAKYKD